MRGSPLAVVWALGAACGGSSAPPPAPAVRALSAEATPAGADDLRVATVNGRPVWGSCVAAQATKTHGDRRAALDQCIAFELMAQAAEQRGLATDPDVVDATHTALASREVELGFEDRVKTAADTGPVLDAWMVKNGFRMHRPELRASSYARVEVAAGAPDQAQHALADRIAAAVKDETGLFGVDLADIAKRTAKGTGLDLEVADAKAMPRASMDPSYAGALFAIPEVGRASAAVRTPWGWDVIVLTEEYPAKESTKEEIAADAFNELRVQAFTRWVDGLIKELGVHVEVHPELLREGAA